MISLAFGVANKIPFVLVDADGDEVTGLGDTFAVEVSNAGGAFGAGNGSKSELGNGWYLYTTSVNESSILGALALRVTGSGVVQQNLLFGVVRMDAGPGAIAWTYTLTSSVDASPIESAQVWVTTDAGGSSVIASGYTDASGQVTFYLDAGTYYIWRQKSGWDFMNPDTEVVS